MSITAPCLTTTILYCHDFGYPVFLSKSTRSVCPLQAQYISQCMAEIKKELKQENMGVKANAISKLTYVCALSCVVVTD